jgi:hypothetical protein
VTTVDTGSAVVRILVILAVRDTVVVTTSLCVMVARAVDVTEIVWVSTSTGNVLKLITVRVSGERVSNKL